MRRNNDDAAAWTAGGRVAEGSGGGGDGDDDDTITDPFAFIGFVDLIPPLEASKSTPSPKSRSMRVRRDSGWRNLEDYDYAD